MRHFKTGNWIDIRGLSNKEKRVLIVVMMYNGVEEDNSKFETAFNSGWDLVFITDNGKINATRMVYKDHYIPPDCNELTPQEAAFMGAPDSVTFVGLSPIDIDRIFWFDNINKGKSLHGWKVTANEKIISMGEVVIDKYHGWTEEDAIFKREKPMSGVDKQIEKLQAELEELKLQRKQELEATNKKKVEKWEPQVGCWYIGLRGIPCVISHTSKDIVQQWTSFGVTCPTEALAEKAANKMRTHNRLLAYVHEHAPAYEWQANKDNCYIQYCSYSKKYIFSQHKSKRAVGFVYMPKDVANKLTYELNNGTVEL